MVSNDYNDDDFRIYVQERAKELQRLAEKVSTSVDVIAAYPDSASVHQALEAAWGPADSLFLTVKQMYVEMFHDQRRTRHGEIHAPLALRVARLRRRREREAKRER